MQTTACCNLVVTTGLYICPELSNFLFPAQITTFNISLVVHGTIAENMDFMQVIKFYF
jgi:hypothetical protein